MKLPGVREGGVLGPKYSLYNWVFNAGTRVGMKAPVLTVRKFNWAHAGASAENWLICEQGLEEFYLETRCEENLGWKKSFKTNLYLKTLSLCRYRYVVAGALCEETTLTSKLLSPKEACRQMRHCLLGSLPRPGTHRTPMEINLCCRQAHFRNNSPK